MQVPQLAKIVVNIGLGEAITNAKALDAAVKDISDITGQRPVITRAKRSIAAFRLRTGMPIGRHGDPARQPDVGVPGQAVQRCAARGRGTSRAFRPRLSTAVGITPWA